MAFSDVADTVTEAATADGIAATGGSDTCQRPALDARVVNVPAAAEEVTDTLAPGLANPQIFARAGACCRTAWSPRVLPNRKTGGGGVKAHIEVL